jgi:glycosyltransferase involved in cell wall biosynthesis
MHKNVPIATPTVVVQFIQSPFFGGPERQLLGLAQALGAQYRSAFFSFDEHGRSRPFLDVVRGAGFETVALERDKPNFIMMVREATRRLRAVDAKIVCVHHYKAALIGLAAARALRIPCIGVSHGWTRETWQVVLYETLDRWALRQMDAVVSVSAAQASKLLRAGIRPERLRVIRNALNAPASKPANPAMRASIEALFPKPPRTLVGSAGRLSFEKGFDQLVLAAEIVLQRDPEVGFVVFGEGVQRAELERQIAARGLQGTVVLPGFRTDLDEVLPCLDIAVLPSRTEGLPVIALEAMAAQVPVVATAVGGTPEAVVDGLCGYLVPSETPPALAQRVLDLAVSPDERRIMGLRGRERVLSDFTFEAQAKSYEALFGELRPKQAAKV